MFNFQQILSSPYQDDDKFKRVLGPSKTLDTFINRHEEKEFSFDLRDININRTHIVYAKSETNLTNIRMYYGFIEGHEIGHVGVGLLTNRVFNVLVHSPYRGHKLGYRLMSFLMHHENPKDLVAKSTGDMSNEKLMEFYSKFGFIKKHHPIHQSYMINENYL